MILFILRLAFALSIVGAAFTGAPAFAAGVIVPGIILLFTDGKEKLILYAIVGVILWVIIAAIA